MFLFCRKIKKLSILLSLFVIIVSCGASIQLHTCNSEGIKTISINKLNSITACGDCCDVHIADLTFKKTNCCDDTFVSAFFKAHYSQNIENFFFKNHLFQILSIQSFFKHFILQATIINKGFIYKIFTPIRYSNTILLIKSVLNI